MTYYGLNRRWLAIMTIFGTMFWSGFTYANPSSLLDTIVVIVNQEVITKLELDEQVLSISKRLKAEGVPLPGLRELRKQVLERMIMSKILTQNAREQGFKASDLRINEAIGNILDREKININQLKIRD